MTPPSTLDSLYRALTETGRRPEGAWHTATLGDGLPVSVVTLAPALAAKVSDPVAFFGELERAAEVRVEGAARPISWGRTDDGVVHCAYERDEDVSDVAPGQKPPAEVAAVGVHLARALAAIHGAGLLHGAISTQRIQGASSGGVQLSALGLHAGLSAGGLGPNAASMILSDLAYLSPEVRAAAPLDPRSDVYSLGAALYELITGKPPFGGRTTSYVMASVLSESDADKGADGADGAMDPVVDAVLRAVERAPEDRWPSAAAFAQALAAGAGLDDEERGRSLFDIFKGAWFSARRSRE